MFRKAFAIASLALLPRLSAAATYHCVVERNGAKTSKKIWSGELRLKDEAETDADVVIIKKGAAVPIRELGLSGGDAAVRAKLKRYDGLLVVGLRKDGQRLDVDLGHVDSASRPNAAPTDVMSWSSLGTREIGVMNAGKNLLISCSLR